MRQSHTAAHGTMSAGAAPAPSGAEDTDHLAVVPAARGGLGVRLRDGDADSVSTFSTSSSSSGEAGGVLAPVSAPSMRHVSVEKSSEVHIGGMHINVAPGASLSLTLPAGVGGSGENLPPGLPAAQCPALPAPGIRVRHLRAGHALADQTAMPNALPPPPDQHDESGTDESVGADRVRPRPVSSQHEKESVISWARCASGKLCCRLLLKRVSRKTLICSGSILTVAVVAIICLASWLPIKDSSPIFLTTTSPSNITFPTTATTEIWPSTDETSTSTNTSPSTSTTTHTSTEPSTSTTTSPSTSTTTQTSTEPSTSTSTGTSTSTPGPGNYTPPPTLSPHFPIPRSAWSARPPNWEFPAPEHPIEALLVFSVNQMCGPQFECAEQIRDIQSSHMDKLHLGDIAFNFVVGGDSSVFEGRGWDRKGELCEFGFMVGEAVVTVGQFGEESAGRAGIKKLVAWGQGLGVVSKNSPAVLFLGPSCPHL